MTENTYIIGAGGEGQVFADILMSNGITPSGFFGDNEALHGKEFLGIPVIGSIEKAKEFKGKFLISIGDNKARKRIFESLGFPVESYGTQINKLSYIGSGSSVGFGSVVLGGVVISTQAEIGNFVIVSIGAIISHHCKIADFSFIGPNAALGGNAQVGEGAFIGLGASVIPGVRIGKWSVIGAGSVIIEDVSDYATVVGNPGKVIKIKGERVK